MRGVVGDDTSRCFLMLWLWRYGSTFRIIASDKASSTQYLTLIYMFIQIHSVMLSNAKHPAQGLCHRLCEIFRFAQNDTQ